jgi:fatty acid elongase 3
MNFLNTTYQAAATWLPQSPVGDASSSEGVVGATSSIPINPWMLFEHGWQTVMRYPTSKFNFNPGTTPMGTFAETACGITTYYLIVFGGRELMRSRSAFRLNNLFIIHNFYLTAISAGLLILFGQELLPGIWKNGLRDSICGETGWSQRLLVLYYLNYLTKYLELLDTVFLVLRKKPLTFLHTYHHGATALLCYTQLAGRTPVSWVPITLNLAVHVVMYW